MSEDTKAAAPAAAVDTSALPPAVAPVVAPRVVDETEPVWLGERIRRAQAQALREAGLKVGKNDDPKVIASEAKKKNEGRKAALKEARGQTETLQTQLAASQAQNAALGVYAAAELAQLTDAQRDAVKKAAGEDVSEQLKFISAFKLSGQLAPPVAAVPAVAAVAAVDAAKTIDAPASTAAAAAAPAPGQAGETDIHAQYRNLKDSNPYAAAEFLLNHPEIAMSKLRGGS